MAAANNMETRISNRGIYYQERNILAQNPHDHRDRAPPPLPQPHQEIADMETRISNSGIYYQERNMAQNPHDTRDRSPPPLPQRNQEVSGYFTNVPQPPQANQATDIIAQPPQPNQPSHNEISGYLTTVTQPIPTDNGNTSPDYLTPNLPAPLENQSTETGRYYSRTLPQPPSPNQSNDTETYYSQALPPPDDSDRQGAHEYSYINPLDDRNRQEAHEYSYANPDGENANSVQIPGVQFNPNQSQQDCYPSWDYFHYAIMVSLFCCCIPLNILAIYKTLMVKRMYRRGNVDEAKQLSKRARCFLFMAIFGGIALYMIVGGAIVLKIRYDDTFKSENGL
ncbi:uncharacterized protein [Amphiura filiformis]|uniref:uncharacterized protein n=1 Tax=Amphiura filiformis TaxID=82378 RepID=UPI003B21EA77